MNWTRVAVVTVVVAFALLWAGLLTGRLQGPVGVFASGVLFGLAIGSLATALLARAIHRKSRRQLEIQARAELWRPTADLGPGLWVRETERPDPADRPTGSPDA